MYKLCQSHWMFISTGLNIVDATLAVRFYIFVLLNALNELKILLLSQHVVQDHTGYRGQVAAAILTAALALAEQNLDELSFDFSLTFPLYVPFVKVRLRLKVSTSKLYGPQVWSLNSLFQRKKLISGTIAHKNYTWVNKIFTLYTSKHLQK